MIFDDAKKTIENLKTLDSDCRFGKQTPQELAKSLENAMELIAEIYRIDDEIEKFRMEKLYAPDPDEPWWNR